MEAASSPPLSIESFSYSWLVNIRSSFESRGNSFRASLDEASFIEMDPTMPPSKRFYFTSSRCSHDFKFPILSPSSPSPSLPLVNADQLISNGYLIPLQAYEGTPGGGVGSPADKLTVERQRKSVESLRKSCRRLSRQIFEKYLNFIRPICRRIHRVGRNNNGNGKTGRKLLIHGGSRRPVTRERDHQCCYDEWRRSSCDSESSIYDAVLHCKRSIEK